MVVPSLLLLTGSVLGVAGLSVLLRANRGVRSPLWSYGTVRPPVFYVLWLAATVLVLTGGTQLKEPFPRFSFVWTAVMVLVAVALSVRHNRRVDRGRPVSD